MCPYLVCFLWILLALSIESKDKVPVQNKRKIILESVETNCDHDFVEYFHRVNNQEMLHTFRVVKLAPSFSLDIVMRSAKSQSIMYKIKKIDGCKFLQNPLMNKVLSQTYRTLIVNDSFFKCPIPPKVYFLRNLTDALMMPSMHPIGHYQLSVRVKMSQSSAPFVMEVLWKYSILYTK